jgi:outer membrane protein OmpA-like peptidoglycan-associated protein
MMVQSGDRADPCHSRRMINMSLFSALMLVALGAGLSGCTGDPDPGAEPTGPAATSNSPVAAVTSGASGATAPATGFARDGFYVLSDFTPVRFRTEMLRIERFADYSVLRFKVTNLEETQRSGLLVFGGGSLGGFGGFHLVDSVNRKMYYALRKDNSYGTAFGSLDTWFQPGIAYEGFVYFPTLSPTVTRMTVLSPGSPGLYAGIPVMDGTEPPQAATEPPVPPGPSPMLGTFLPQGTIYRASSDLVGLTEDEAQSTTTSASEETIGLRTDVLFAFDSASLSDRAKTVLDEVAAETQAKADPAKPPIIVTGHTDSKGETAYNLTLSRQRAAAVQRELQARLGRGYQYRASGLGESTPIAEEGGADDAQARARNRRVEISYQIKQISPGTTTTATAGAQPATSPIAPPAQFRLDDTIATERTATVDGVRYRLKLPPAYRDGAFLVVPLEFTRDQPVAIGQWGTKFNDLSSGCIGNYTDFTATDPTTETTLVGVQIGPTPDSTPYCLDGTGGGNSPNIPVQSYVYLPAPAAGTTSITLNAGPFGTIENVPVEVPAE